MSNDPAYLTPSETPSPMPAKCYLGNVRLRGTMRPTWQTKEITVNVVERWDETAFAKHEQQA